MKPKQTHCPTCGRKRARTSQQSRRLHKLFTELAANVKAKDGLYHPMPWWKVMLKDRYLGYDEYTRPDGKTVYSLRSEADLEVDEENEFMMQVEQFAAERGVYLDAMETLT
jgi:hypothetical protein